MTAKTTSREITGTVSNEARFLNLSLFLLSFISADESSLIIKNTINMITAIAPSPEAIATAEETVVVVVTVVINFFPPVVQCIS